MHNDYNNDERSGSTSMAGGFFIALFTLIGFFVGAFNSEVSIGTIGGFIAGIIVAIIIWRKDSQRDQD